VLAALAALTSRSVARGLAASWAWVWLLGVFAALLILAVPSAGTQPLGGLDVWAGRSDGATRAFGIVARALAVLGPAAVAGLVGFASVRRGSRVSAAVVGGAAGPLLVVLAYQSRISALVDGNGGWAWTAFVAFVASLVGAGVGAALANSRLPKEPD
jgi:hypothetical protein